MAKRTPSQNYAIRQKVLSLQEDGLPRDRATAAAFRMFRAGELSTAAVSELSGAQQKQRKGYMSSIIKGAIAYNSAKKAASKPKTRKQRLARRRRR